MNNGFITTQNFSDSSLSFDVEIKVNDRIMIRYRGMKGPRSQNWYQVLKREGRIRGSDVWWLNELIRLSEVRIYSAQNAIFIPGFTI